ncbi:MAG: ATP synthase F0 subunit B [Kofleriaceae bacterium]
MGAQDHPLIDIDLTVLVQFFLFIVLFFAAKALLFEPYLRLRERRSAGIEGARAEAVRMSAQAEGALTDYEQKLAAARTRAGDESRTIRTAAAAHEREVTGEARAKAVAAIESAQAEVRSQTEVARKELMAQAEPLARAMAGKLLGREVA